jgi:hypothetical protein
VKTESREKRLGYSPITGRVYIGPHNGTHWIGKKKDITSEFIAIVLEMFKPGYTYTISVNGVAKSEITVKEARGEKGD